MQYYQGDVGLIKTDKNQNIQFKNLPKDGLVVALGEVTGHKHTVIADKDSAVKFGVDEHGTYIVDIQKGQALLTHEQHKTQTLSRGVWILPVQYEYDEIQELRKVQD